jgi:hypothetical protein
MKITKKNSSPKKKLLSAIAMLTVSAVTLSTATYAWFTMNKEVRVTGMEVKTQVGDSLLIATSSAGTGKAADSIFQNGLNQSVYGLVNPVSTINGSDGSFFYTYDANADGSKSADTGVIPYTAVGNSDSFTVGTDTYKAYLDYVFEIKAINTESTAQYLNLTGLNLLYDGQQLSDEHAYRVAIFSQDLASGGTEYVASTTGSAASKIFAPTGYTYFGTGDKAVKTTAVKDDVSPSVNDSSAGWSKQIAGNSTDYTKITVRLWLEGEDDTCFSEKFSEKLDEWTLDLKFNLEANTTNAVKLIGSTQNATANATSKEAALSIGTETAASYQWYKCAEGGETNNDTLVTGQATNTLTATAAGKYYCVITTAKGTQFRTNSIVVSG